MQQPPFNGGRSDTGFVQQLEQRMHVQGGLFDETITSGIEDSTGELTYDGRSRDMKDQRVFEDNEDYDMQATERYNQYVQRGGHGSKHVVQHALQHKQSHSPPADTEPDEQYLPYGKKPSHAISGRFEQSGKWEQNIPDRGGNVLNPQRQVSNKRGHPDERVDSDDQPEYIEQPGSSQQESDAEGYEDGGEGEEEDPDLHGLHGNMHYLKQEPGNGGTGPRNEGMETEAPSPSPQMRRREHIEQAVHAVPDPSQLDHSDEHLKRIPYATLMNETWDPLPPNPKRANPNYPDPKEAPDYSFKDCVDYVIRDESPDFQADFFQRISIEEFEQAGDIFVEKFAELMRKICMARRRKREVVEAFEREVEVREEAVRGRLVGMDGKFEEMRSGGEGVLRGRVNV